MAEIVVNEQAISALVNDPAGGIARVLEGHAHRMAERVREHLSTPQPPRARGERQINESKVPWMRSGDLRESVRVAQLFDVTEQTLMYGIVADSIHDGAQYSAILLAQGFKLAPDDILTPQ